MGPLHGDIMKFNCGSTWETRLAEKRYAALRQKRDYEEWHKWYAWYPVRVGKNDCRWLETVERIYIGVDVYPSHRLPMSLFVGGPTAYNLIYEEINYRGKS